MAFDIKQHAAVERPVIASGRGGTSNLPALTEEVRPLLDDALALPTDKALPVVLPADQATDLVRALRAAGAEKGVTVRFKWFPRLNDNGEPMHRFNEGTGEQTALSDPFEYTNKARTTVRVTFWTTKKITRQRKAKTD